MLGVAALGGWLALHRDGAQPAMQVAAVAAPRIVTAPRERGPEPDAPAVTAPREPGPEHAPPAVSPAAAVARSAHAGEPSELARPAETVHLHLTSTPGGATVALDGKRLGATPLDVELPRHAGEAQLVVSHAGFADVRQRLDLRDDRRSRSCCHRSRAR